MEAARTSETSVDNYFTRQYIPEDNSELHTRRRENLKSHKVIWEWCVYDPITIFRFSWIYSQAACNWELIMKWNDCERQREFIAALKKAQN
jgi:hypothetical protein